MRCFFDILTVVGFLLTALGTYLTIRSGCEEVLIAHELLRYGSIVIIILSYFVYHYFRKYHIARSVFKGRSRMIEAFFKSVELSNELQRGNPSLKSCIESLNVVCQLIAKGIREYTDVPISVCILYVNQDESQRLYVKALSRDVDTGMKRNQQAELYKEVTDYISCNTDFSKIVECISSQSIKNVYFFSNCLPTLIGYKNTHLIGKWNTWLYRIIAFLTFGFLCWHLPYKSSIVVPIIPYDKQGQKYIEGFLCIDSPKTFSFLKKYDLAILQDMASMIYPAMKLFNEKHMQ